MLDGLARLSGAEDVESENRVGYLRSGPWFGVCTVKHRRPTGQPLRNVEFAIGETRTKGGSGLGRPSLSTLEMTWESWSSLVQDSMLGSTFNVWGEEILTFFTRLLIL